MRSPPYHSKLFVILKSVFEDTRGLQMWESVGSPLLIAGLHPTGSSKLRQSFLLI